MPARHFLCCLPLRLGALLISLAQLGLFGLVAAASWYFISTMRGRLPTHLSGVIITNAIYYTLLALAALLGLFGTIARKASLLSTYAFALGWAIGFQLVIDVIYMIGIFSQSHQKLVDRCINGSTDQDVKDLCNNFFSSRKWALLAGMIISLIIQFWAARVIDGYAKKLTDERTWRSGPNVVVVGNVGPKYSNVNQNDTESQIPLTGASYAYPYSDTSNSFGHANHHHSGSTA